MLCTPSHACTTITNATTTVRPHQQHSTARRTPYTASTAHRTPYKAQHTTAQLPAASNYQQLPATDTTSPHAATACCHCRPAATTTQHYYSHRTPPRTKPSPTPNKPETQPATFTRMRRCVPGPWAPAVVCAYYYQGGRCRCPSAPETERRCGLRAGARLRLAALTAR
jgi:hypothetical protein